MTLLASVLAASGLPAQLKNVSNAIEVLTTDACPPCEILFRNLKRTGTNGKLVQDVKVQERGEPKSGTGIMFDWASRSLVLTCHYLQKVFGEELFVVNRVDLFGSVVARTFTCIFIKMQPADPRVFTRPVVSARGGR